MAKVLVATLYKPDPVILASNRLGPDKLILIINKNSSPEQERAVKLIKDSLGLVLKVKFVKIDVYNISRTAEKCVNIIDSQNKDDILYVNITSGRKTMALALLFAAYARASRIKKIAYNPEEDSTSVVYLPKLSFHLTESQKKLLEAAEKEDFSNYTELAEKIGVSRAMLYRNLDELKNMGLLVTEPELKLTDAGRLARL